MKLGIVGLPNVGKSTLFNAITNAGAQSANYAFCTIEPNVGVVAVPDYRLDKLAEMYHPRKSLLQRLSLWISPALSKALPKARGSAINFCPISAKWMRLSTWFVALTMTILFTSRER